MVKDAKTYVTTENEKLVKLKSLMVYETEDMVRFETKSIEGCRQTRVDFTNDQCYNMRILAYGDE